MKKKLMPFILALVCALAFAFGLAACDDGNDSVNGTVQIPEHVTDIALVGDGVLDKTMTETERRYLADKNVELEIWLELDQDHEIGSLKMYINDEETALTLDTRPSSIMNGKLYICKYTPTADFTITFSGAVRYAPKVAVTSVTLNKTELALTVGDEETLTATVGPDDATNKTVTWSSSDTNIATVDGNGKVVAVAQGTAVISAHADLQNADCTVTVNNAPVTEVTAAEWTEALSEIENYTYTQKTDDWSMTHKLDDNKLEISESDGSDGIVVQDGETFYMFTKHDGAWQRKTLTSEQAEEEGISLAEERQILQPCKDDFDSFTYKDGKYIAATLDKTLTMNGTLKNVTVKFSDGKLVEVSFDFIQSDGDGDIIAFELKDVGTTTIPVPTDYTDYDPDKAYKVTAEEWDEIMDSTDNFTLATTLHMSGSLGDITSTEKYDGLIKYVDDSSTGKAYYFDGCTYSYHKYRYDNGGFSEWQITSYSDDPYDNSLLDVMFKGGYGSFAYTDEKYITESYEVTMEGQKITLAIVVISFYDGKLQSILYNVGTKAECYIDNVGTTSFEVPALCPVENGQTIEIPTGTPAKVLYEEYPALNTLLGKWELYMQMNSGNWYPIGDEQEMPEGSYNCKLVYNGIAEEQPEDITFTIVGTTE